jgi:uncharacterized cupin superfamily protein
MSLAPARPGAVLANLDDAALTDWTLEGDQIDAGAPSARGAVVWRSTDETRAAGFWVCSSGAFSRTYAWTETTLILDGSAVVTTADGEHRLEAGALLVLPVGISASWEIPEQVQTAFHLAADTPLTL